MPRTHRSSGSLGSSKRAQKRWGGPIRHRQAGGRSQRPNTPQPASGADVAPTPTRSRPGSRETKGELPGLRHDPWVARNRRRDDAIFPLERKYQRYQTLTHQYAVRVGCRQKPPLPRRPTRATHNSTKDSICRSHHWGASSQKPACLRENDAITHGCFCPTRRCSPEDRKSRRHASVRRRIC